jgi:hypothetical protein
MHCLWIIYNVDAACCNEMFIANYYIIIVAPWSYAYMIIHMHIYAFHMELMASHRHHAVTSIGTWSCMRGWHRLT